MVLGSKDGKIGQGKEAVRAFLKANPEIDQEITEKIKKELFNKEEVD